MGETALFSPKKRILPVAAWIVRNRCRLIERWDGWVGVGERRGKEGDQPFFAGAAVRLGSTGSTRPGDQYLTSHMSIPNHAPNGT